MPMPVSSTSKRTSSSSPAVFQQPARRAMCPVGELDGVAGIVEQGLAQPRRVAAQPGGTASQSTSTASPLVARRSPMIEATLSSTRSQWKVGAFQLQRPASILDRSRMSLMIASRWRPAASILSSRVGLFRRGAPRRRMWVRPMMAFIGVRISWLMLARKAALGPVGGFGLLPRGDQFRGALR
jgi:hypothetical protein